MKPKAMEVSPYAYNMLQAFNEWGEASSKKDYRFSKEEQYYLEQMIKVMNNQIDMLVAYEIEKKNSN